MVCRQLVQLLSCEVLCALSPVSGTAGGQPAGQLALTQPERKLAAVAPSHAPLRLSSRQTSMARLILALACLALALASPATAEALTGECPPRLPPILRP